MPLIGAADVSLRGLRSPEGDEQKAFWSSPSAVRSRNFGDGVPGSDNRTFQAKQTKSSLNALFVCFILEFGSLHLSCLHEEYFRYLFYYHHPRQLNKIVIRPDIQLLRITHKRKYFLFYLLYISCRKAFFQLLLELF